jgi:hypothetical protein
VGRGPSAGRFEDEEDIVSARHFVRHYRQVTDREISRAFTDLVRYPDARATFGELLASVRQLAPRVLQAPIVSGCHPGVNALFFLSRWRPAYIRTLASWEGSQASWRPAIHALAEHLLARYPVPRFLGAAWYAIDALDEQKRRWFVAHAAGARFRSLDLPIDLTSRMEHIFLRSPDHVGIEYAMRRAELFGLGVPDRFVEQVLQTRMAQDLSQGPFWRTVWQFLIDHATEMRPGDVGSLVYVLRRIRHEGIAPEFSLKGRTPRSLMRLVDEWENGRGSALFDLSWPRSSIRPMTVAVSAPQVEVPLRYDLVELTTSEQLRAEGAALQHCVADYGQTCWRGLSQIWSLRSTRGARTKSIVTIEVDPKRQEIVQAKGFRNRRPTSRARALITDWAARERLRVKTWQDTRM